MLGKLPDRKPFAKSVQKVAKTCKKGLKRPLFGAIVKLSLSFLRENLIF